MRWIWCKLLRKVTFALKSPSGVRLIDLNATRALTSIVPLVGYLRREVPDFMISGAIQTNIAAAVSPRLARAPTRLMLTEHNPISVIAADVSHTDDSLACAPILSAGE